jgi:Na+/phosphate symporter
MTDAQARTRVWTRCLAALVLCALTGPLAGLLTPLTHDPAPLLHVVAAALAAVLVGAYVALAVLFARAVRRVVWPRSTDQRSPALHAHRRSAILG